MGGAQPWNWRAATSLFVQPLALRLLRGEFHDGDTIVADAQDGHLGFSRAEASLATAPE